MIEGTDAGLTFEPGRSDDLADCIERVLTDHVLADELTRNARELIERNYSWAAIATATAGVYSTAIRARQR
jgi:glycogen(starch) synthase